MVKMCRPNLSPTVLMNIKESKKHGGLLSFVKYPNQIHFTFHFCIVRDGFILAWCSLANGYSSLSPLQIQRHPSLVRSASLPCVWPQKKASVLNVPGRNRHENNTSDSSSRAQSYFRGILLLKATYSGVTKQLLCFIKKDWARA